jgi:repressor LexA
MQNQAQILQMIDTQDIKTTIRDIGKSMGWTSTGTVARHLERMRDQGLMTWQKGRPRTWEITDAGREYVKKHGGEVNEQEESLDR